MSSFARWEERSARAGTVWMSEWMRRSLLRGTYWAVALRMTIPFDLTCYYRVTRPTLHVAKHEEEQHPVSKQSRYPCNSALGSPGTVLAPRSDAPGGPPSTRVVTRSHLSVDAVATHRSVAPAEVRAGASPLPRAEAWSPCPTPTGGA